MPLILPGNVATATADVAYSVANSCRFNDDDSAYMHKTPDDDGNRQRWTFSCWVKRGIISSGIHSIINAQHSTSTHGLRFNADDKLDFHYYAGGYQGRLETTRLFRDPAAWYNIIAIWDTPNATADSRMRLIINGVEETAFDTRTNPGSEYNGQISWSTKVHHIGDENTSNYFDGYIAEAVLIDGSVLAATSFGEFNEDSPTIWQPIDVSELTFGTNGFYLDFEASDNLGNDANGGTDLTEVNLAAADQATDTPTNNFCVVNALDNYYAASTFSEGNCKVATGASNQTFNLGTFGLSTGKWFWEAYLTTAGGEEAIGIGALASTGTSDYGGKTAFSYSFKGNNGNIRNNDSNISYGNGYAQDVVIGVALNLDDNEIKFYKDGVVENSGTAQSITAAASTPTGLYFPMFGDVDTDSVTWSVNFGGSPASTVSSANQDADGYGNFEYAVPSGFYAICTKNLATYG